MSLFNVEEDIKELGIDISAVSNFYRGNFVESLSLRCRDKPWMKFKINEQLEMEMQTTGSLYIQNELLKIVAYSVLYGF